MNELEDNDIRDKRERLVACVLSGNSKMYLGKEYTEEPTTAEGVVIGWGQNNSLGVLGAL